MPAFTFPADGPQPSDTAPLCLVAGVGPGIGASLVRKFASQGYIVLMLARSGSFLTSLSTSLLSLTPPSFAVPLPTDLTSSSSISTTFAHITSLFPSRPITVFLYNAAQRRLSPQPLHLIPSSLMLHHLQINALAFHFLLPFILPAMQQANTGTIIVTGATGGVRSSPGFGSFSASKWALRAMVGCLAKEVVGEGIHVVHVIVDSAVDTPLLRSYVQRQRDKESTTNQQPTSGALHGRLASSVVLTSPDSIAAEYYHLHCQPRDAWSLEVDLRPYNEPITARL